MATRSDTMMISCKKIGLILLLTASCLVHAAGLSAELIERVVAVVNDEVILLSEFNVAIRQAEEGSRQVTHRELVDEMINAHLLLEQAVKFGLRGGDTESALIDPEKAIENYIDKRIRALIYIPFRDVEAYYYNNLEKYGERDFYNVKREIEEYLLNRMLEIKLQEHINELRESARIIIQVDEE